MLFRVWGFFVSSVVKFSLRLALEEKISFLDGHQLMSYGSLFEFFESV